MSASNRNLLFQLRIPRRVLLVSGSARYKISGWTVPGRWGSGTCPAARQPPCSIDPQPELGKRKRRQGQRRPPESRNLQSKDQSIRGGGVSVQHCSPWRDITSEPGSAAPEADTSDTTPSLAPSDVVNRVYTLRHRNAEKRIRGRLVVSKGGEAYDVQESEIQIGNSD